MTNDLNPDTKNNELVSENAELRAELDRERQITRTLIFSLEALRTQVRIAYVPATHWQDVARPERALCKAHGHNIRTSNVATEVSCGRCIGLKEKREAAQLEAVKKAVGRKPRVRKA